MKFIKIWCEYDISGDFGGNNEEDLLIVENESVDIAAEVLNIIKNRTGLSEEDLEGLYDWEFITPTYL